MMKLYGLKLGVILVFTANAPGKWDLHAGNRRYYWEPRFRIAKRVIEHKNNTEQKKPNGDVAIIPVDGALRVNETITTVFEDETVMTAAITTGCLIVAEQEINQILETCLFKIEETKTRPFHTFVDQMLFIIKKYWHFFKTKFSREEELTQLVQELEDIRFNKNILSVGRTLSKYKKLLPTTSLIHSTGLLTLKGLLSARLAI